VKISTGYARITTCKNDIVKAISTEGNKLLNVAIFLPQCEKGNSRRFSKKNRQVAA